MLEVRESDGAVSAHTNADQRRVLVVAILGSTMAFLDGSVVNVVLPVLQRELVATAAEMQWIVEAYALFLAALVLVGGALGDRYGRKKMFLYGASIFAASSLACAASPNAVALIVARGAQGIGAALLVPGGLALISAAYRDRTERGTAIGTWSSVSAITTAIGPVAGGWLVSHTSWRWVFVINAPIAASTLALAGKIEESRDEEAKGPLDWAGAALAVTGLGGITYAMLEAPASGGFGSARTLVVLAIGVVLLLAFLFYESRIDAPMVDLSLFRIRPFAVTNVLTFFLYAALNGALFYLPFDLVQVQHRSPAEAGAALLPFVVAISVLSPWAGKFVERFGPRWPLVLGPLAAAAGMAALAWPTVGGSYWTTFFPGIAVAGIGMGITVAPLTSTVMGAVAARHAGEASGINNAVSRVGGLLAIAMLGVLFGSVFDASLDARLAPLGLSPASAAVVSAQRDRLAGADLSTIEPAVREAVRASFDDAFVTAFRGAVLACAALALVAGVSAVALSRDDAARD